MLQYEVAKNSFIKQYNIAVACRYASTGNFNESNRLILKQNKLSHLNLTSWLSGEVMVNTIETVRVQIVLWKDTLRQFFLLGNLSNLFQLLTIPLSSSSSSFGLSLQSGVATAYHVSPNGPVFNVRPPRTNFPYIFFHYI